MLHMSGFAYGFEAALQKYIKNFLDEETHDIGLL